MPSSIPPDAGSVARDGTPPGLRGRVALITGVSRRQGIAFATARRLLASGADVFLTHHHAHDVRQEWGGDSVEDVVAQLREEAPQCRVEHLGADLADPAAPSSIVRAAVTAFGHVDILACVHAQSGSDGPLRQQSAAWLDSHYAVNTRSTLLLTKEFTEQHDGRSGGRVVWFTSGQNLGPMVNEIAYATSKAALSGIVASVADDLIDTGITVNVVNPGPVDTAYLAGVDPTRAMPLGRWGEPDDPARLVAFLVSDDARWITGQVINTEGGFRRYVPLA